MYGSRNAQSLSLRQLFNALCQYDASAGYRVVRDDHFAQRNTDSKLRADFTGKLAIVVTVRGLKFQGGTYGLRRFTELGHESIAADLMRGAAMANDGFREAPKRILDTLVCDQFVRLNQSGRTDDIGMQDDSEFGAGCHCASG
jgi:hypothetical protein